MLNDRSTLCVVDKPELMTLQKKFREIAQRQGNPSSVTREEFTEALNIVGIAESGEHAAQLILIR